MSCVTRWCLRIRAAKEAMRRLLPKDQRATMHIGDAAILLTPHDPEAWTQAMLDLASDRQKRGLGCARPGQAFSVGDGARSMLSIYEEAVRSPKRTAPSQATQRSREPKFEPARRAEMTAKPIVTIAASSILTLPPVSAFLERLDSCSQNCCLPVNIAPWATSDSRNG